MICCISGKRIVATECLKSVKTASQCIMGRPDVNRRMLDVDDVNISREYAVIFAKNLRSVSYPHSRETNVCGNYKSRRVV